MASDLLGDQGRRALPLCGGILQLLRKDTWVPQHGPAQKFQCLRAGLHTPWAYPLEPLGLLPWALFEAPGVGDRWVQVNAYFNSALPPSGRIAVWVGTMF